jgi:hypothetical protein
MPAQFTLPPDTRAVGTGNPPADMNAHTDALAAIGATFSVLNAAYAGGADPTGIADSTAAINAAEVAAAATGGIVTFPAGTFKVTGLTKQASSIWQGAGRNQTTIQLANGANTDVVQGANFGTLTLSGSIGGIGGWGIRDLTIDGNKGNQSGTSNGLRVYGYNWDLYNVSIRNCLTEGLTTEWSVSSGAPAGADSTMEARIYGVKIYNCGATGWHDRGPHDSRTVDLTIFSNGAAFPGYWAEGAGATTVAAGSNGVVASTFAGAGTLNVATTLNYPAASINSTQGSLTLTGLTGGTGTCVITYTGTTATTFTGCTTVSGSGTLATGNPVTMTGGGFSAAGKLMFGGHPNGAGT